MLRLPSKFLVLLVAAADMAVALEHGPVLQWYRDPTTTMAVTWIETGSQAGQYGQWAVGPAGFGYGDNDDRTALPGMKGKFRTVYLRREYAVPATAGPGAELQLELRYDDGVVIYLDGREVARRGVEGAGNTVQSVKSHEAEKWETIPLGKAVAGKKGIIAIECHNTNLLSSDLTVDPQVVVRRDGKGEVVIPAGAQWEYLVGAIPEANWFAQLAPKGQPAVVAGPLRFEFRVQQDRAWSEAAITTRRFGDTADSVHCADLAGLKPGTTYEGRITVRSGDVLGPFRFETAPRDFHAPLRFVTGGDMFHTRAKLDAMNRRAGAEDPLFALLGGDLAYGNGTNAAKWTEWFDSWAANAVAPDGRMIPMVVVIGNHEVKGRSFRPDNAPGRAAAPFYYSLFQGQEEGSNTTVDFGQYLSLVCLDSGHTGTIAEQTPWLKRVLAARATVPRLFVCYHRPAWGTGVKDDAVEIQQQWSPLFEQFRVDAVFENDHHVYKRTHPITRGVIDEEDGVVYLGDGSWGVNVRQIPRNWKADRPWLAQAAAVNHLIAVTMTDDGFLYEAKKADGTVIDRLERPLRR